MITDTIINTTKRYVHLNAHILYHIVRITYGLLWLDGAKWKIEGIPDFGLQNRDNLYFWITRAIEYPVFYPYTLFVENLVLPNFQLFAWGVLILELIIGLGFIIGKKLYIFCILAMLQTTAIILSVAKAPNEWIWSYILMYLVAIALLNIDLLRYGKN